MYSTLLSHVTKKEALYDFSEVCSERVLFLPPPLHTVNEVVKSKAVKLESYLFSPWPFSIVRHLNWYWCSGFDVVLLDRADQDIPLEENTHTHTRYYFDTYIYTPTHTHTRPERYTTACNICLSQNTQKHTYSMQITLQAVYDYRHIL